MFKLLRDAFRIDVRVPNHGRSHERVGHFSARQSQVANPTICEIYLAYVDPVGVFRERAVHLVVIAKGNVRRTRAGARLEADAEEEIVNQGPAQSDAQTIPGPIPLKGVARWIDRVRGSGLAVPDFVAKPGVAVEFQFGDRGGKFQLACGSRRVLLGQFSSDFLSFLIVDQAFLHQQVQQRSTILCTRGSTAKQQTAGGCDEHRFSEKHSLSFVAAEAGVG